MADKCDPIRLKLRVQEEELKKLPRTELGPNGKPVPNPDFVVQERKVKKTRSDLQKCVKSLPG